MVKTCLNCKTNFNAPKSIRKFCSFNCNSLFRLGKKTGHIPHNKGVSIKQKGNCKQCGVSIEYYITFGRRKPKGIVWGTNTNNWKI